MAHLYSGQLTVEVPNFTAAPDDKHEEVYQAFRARLEEFAKSNDRLIREHYRKLGIDSKEVTVDFE